MQLRNEEGFWSPLSYNVYLTTQLRQKRVNKYKENALLSIKILIYTIAHVAPTLKDTY